MVEKGCGATLRDWGGYDPKLKRRPGLARNLARSS